MNNNINGNVPVNNGNNPNQNNYSNNNMPNNPNPNYNGNNKRKPKPVFKEWWFWLIIGIGAFFLFVGLIAGLSGDDQSNDNSKNSAATNVTGEATEKVTEAKEVEEDAEEKTQFTVGETASCGGVKYKFKKAVVSHGQDFSQPSKGKEFVICVFKIKNDSEEKVDVHSYDFEAYCDDSAIDNSYMVGNLDLYEKYGSLSVNDLAPGKKATGCLIYEVPKGWKKLELNADIDNGLFGEKEVKFIVKNKK